MPIGTSDGKYYEDSIQFAAREGVRLFAVPRDLDDVDKNTYNDTPTDAQRLRDSYKELKDRSNAGHQYEVLPPSVLGDDKALTPVYDPEEDLIKMKELSHEFEWSSQKKLPITNAPDPSQPPIDDGQDASVEPINDRTEGRSLRDTIRSGAQWIQENLGIGKESYVKDFMTKFSNSKQFLDLYLEGKVDHNDPNLINAITTLSSTAGGIGLASSPLRTGSLGVFGGHFGAKGLGSKPKESLELARDMWVEGRSPIEIWKKTGWMWDEVDSTFKFEIPDTHVQMKIDIPEGKVVQEGTKDMVEGGVALKDVIDHPFLFKAYPDLQKTPVFYNPELKDAFAQYAPKQGRHQDYIEVGPMFKELDPDRQASILLHEIQHAIQWREKGFSKGANTDVEGIDEVLEHVDTLEKAVQSAVEGKEKFDDQKLSDILNTLTEAKNWIKQNKDKAWEAYWNDPGEKEARIVEQRFLASKGRRLED